MNIEEVVKILRRDGYWGENENVKAFEIVLDLAQKVIDREYVLAQYHCDYCHVNCRLMVAEGVREPYTCPYNEGKVSWKKIEGKDGKT